jgi:RNA-binding protein
LQVKANQSFAQILMDVGRAEATLIWYGCAPRKSSGTRMTTATLSEKQRKYLRGLGHGRDPIVMIGQSGLSAGVTKELDLALDAHELVKVRARVGDREERDSIFTTLTTHTGSALVQRIGNVGLFYRRHKEKPKIILPAD